VVPTIEHRPPTVLKLLGDKTLAAKEHTGHPFLDIVVRQQEGAFRLPLRPPCECR
jgi:hypothetical protein